MNKRGLEDSLFSWIVAFSLICFIMLIYLIIVTVQYSTGSNSSLSIEPEKTSSLEETQFLLLLSHEINVRGKSIRILDALNQQLDPFFEIKNDKGETFTQIFGLSALNGNPSELRRDLYVRGFSENSWDQFITAQGVLSESETTKKIIEEFRSLCSSPIANSFLLGLPYGVITPDGLKSPQLLEQDIFVDTDENLLVYTPTITFQSVYRGESFELHFRRYKECNEK